MKKNMFKGLQIFLRHENNMYKGPQRGSSTTISEKMQVKFDNFEEIEVTRILAWEVNKNQIYKLNYIGATTSNQPRTS